MIRSTLRAAAAAILAALTLAGCSPQSRPVARVGKHTLTVGDFERTARRAGEALQLPAEQAKPLLLKQMIDNELLLVAAEAHGLDTTTFTKQRRHAATEQALLAALAAQLAPTDPGVTEAEVRQMYAWRGTQSDLEFVYAPDSAAIELARRRIEAGEPMARVADEFGTGVLPPGGRIGLRVPGSFPQPLDDAMRTLPVGKIGGPYHASIGWFLVRVSRRLPAPQNPFEEERAALENLVRQRKWQGTLLGAVSRLGPAYHLAIADDAGQSLFRLLTPGRVGGLDESAPTPAARAQVLARFDGGVYTVGDAWEDLARPELNKPNSSLVSSLREWVRDRTVTRIALVEARRRHLDEEPAFVHQISDQMNDYILRGEYANVIAGVGPPDEAALRAAWEPMKARYPMLREAHILWTTIADTAKVMAIGQQAGRGSLRDVARAVDPAIVVHEETLRFPTADPQWASVQSALQQLEPGQWANPDFTPAGIRVVQLLDKAQGELSWDQLPADKRQSFASYQVQVARDARVAAYTDSLRRVVNPTPLPDALRGVPWPVPAEGKP